MDVIKAAYGLKDIIINSKVDSMVLEGGQVLEPEEMFPKGGKEHLTWMCDRIIGNELDTERQRVEGEKAHRWIGWIQGCLYMNGIVTLDEMKELNKKS